MSNEIPEGDDIFESLRGEPMSIEGQRGILADMTARFRQEWDRSDIMRGVFDSINEDMGDVRTSLLRTGNDFVPGSQELDILVDHIVAISPTSTRLKQRRVTVAIFADGFVFPRGRFSQEQADLVARQVRELDALRTEGILPNMDGALTINDPSTRISFVNREA